MSTLIAAWRKAIANPAAVAGAREALELLKGWHGSTVYRMPGCATLDRLAVRIDRGMTVEQAAAREYLYRWSLPLLQWINFAETDRPRGRNSVRRVTGAWPVPHAIGLDGIAE